ncbi:MAG: DUF1266 domain-containing protein [Clostridiales bacterium]|nr:DUF1266 domain-containing protein [Clostridiales bacterium]
MLTGSISKRDAAFAISLAQASPWHVASIYDLSILNIWRCAVLKLGGVMNERSLKGILGCGSIKTQAQLERIEACFGVKDEDSFFERLNDADVNFRVQRYYTDKRNLFLALPNNSITAYIINNVYDVKERFIQERIRQYMYRIAPRALKAYECCNKAEIILNGYRRGYLSYKELIERIMAQANEALEISPSRDAFFIGAYLGALIDNKSPRRSMRVDLDFDKLFSQFLLLMSSRSSFFMNMKWPSSLGGDAED